MDFMLEDIPDGLWKRIGDAAAARGKTQRDFLLDAAFNEIERTGAVLASGQAPGSGKAAKTPGGTGKRASVAPDVHLRNLRAVGIKTFIGNFEMLRDWDNNELVKFFREKYDYAYNSANTKASMGKRIIRDKAGLHTCLDYVANKAKNIDHSVKKKARKLLDDIFRGA